MLNRIFSLSLRRQTNYLNMEMISSETVTTTQTVSPVDAIWSIIQSQNKDVKEAIYLRIKEEYKKSAAENECILQKLSELEEGPVGFLKLDSILPPSSLSVEELYEDAYKEKYGI